MKLRSFYGTVSVLIPSVGAVFLILPSSWIVLAAQSALAESLVQSWPKIMADSLTISQYGSVLAMRYQLSSLTSIALFPVVGLIGAWRVIRQGVSDNPRPAYLRRSAEYHFIFLLAILAYLAIFDQYFVSSDARRARAIFRTVACIWWLPLLSGCFAIGIQRLAEVLVARAKGIL